MSKLSSRMITMYYLATFIIILIGHFTLLGSMIAFIETGIFMELTKNIEKSILLTILALIIFIYSYFAIYGLINLP